MKRSLFATLAAAMIAGMIASAAAQTVPSNAPNSQQLAKIVPGHSNKAEVQSLLGSPWRVIQFNDCGMAMDGQADETWEYRAADGNSGYRVHIEFGDDNLVHLIAKIPEMLAGGQAVTAKVAPAHAHHGMSM
jgi:hypothetical protein